MTHDAPVSRTPMLLFTAGWALAIAVFIATFWLNPPIAGLAGPEAYGTSAPGELSFVLSMSIVELVLSGAILRPWSYRQSAGRAIAALLLLTPWLLLRGVAGLHSGPTVHTHTTWLIVYWFALFVASLVSAAGLRRERRRAREVAA